MDYEFQVMDSIQYHSVCTGRGDDFGDKADVEGVPYTPQNDWGSLQC